jgi:short-subunit dehydrogenase
MCLVKNKETLFVITGTSRGIGRDLKSILIDNNIDVIGINRTVQDEKDIYIDLCDAVSLPQKLISLKNLIEENYNNHQIIFINNASLVEPVAPLNKIESGSIIDLINVNVISPLLFFNFLTKLKNPWLIVNMQSGTAKTLNKYLGLYSVSKLTVEKYLEFIKLEENSNCIGIYNYDPKIVQTGMNEALRKNKFFNNDKFNDTIPRDSRQTAYQILEILKPKVYDG